MESDGFTEADEKMASQIRSFALRVEEPEKWMVLIPVESFDQVLLRLDTSEADLGTEYHGVALCYTENHDEVRVRYKSALSDHMERGEDGNEGKRKP